MAGRRLFRRSLVGRFRRSIASGHPADRATTLRLPCILAFRRRRSRLDRSGTRSRLHEEIGKRRLICICGCATGARRAGGLYGRFCARLRIYPQRILSRLGFRTRLVTRFIPAWFVTAQIIPAWFVTARLFAAALVVPVPGSEIGIVAGIAARVERSALVHRRTLEALAAVAAMGAVTAVMAIAARNEAALGTVAALLEPVGLPLRLSLRLNLRLRLRSGIEIGISAPILSTVLTAAIVGMVGEPVIVVALVTVLIERSPAAPILLAQRFLRGGDDAKIVLRMLKIRLGGYRIARNLSIAGELAVFLGHMLSGAAHFDVRTVRLVAARQRIGTLAAAAAAHTPVLCWSHGYFSTFNVSRLLQTRERDSG